MSWGELIVYSDKLGGLWSESCDQCRHEYSGFAIGAVLVETNAGEGQELAKTLTLDLNKHYLVGKSAVNMRPGKYR